MTPARAIGVVGLVGGIAFGALGGEYGSIDWFSLKQEVRQERQLIENIGIEIDSLTRYLRALETDPAAVERVAREKIGMIRDGELLYRIEPEER